MVARMASKAAVVMSMRIISEEFLPPLSFKYTETSAQWLIESILAALVAVV
jgi:hypothetical protein